MGATVMSSDEVSRWLICPKCASKLNKPQLYQTLGRTARAGGDIFLMGEEGFLPCPNCGYKIAKLDIIEGKYDPPEPRLSHRGHAIARLFAVVGAVVAVKVAAAGLVSGLLVGWLGLAIGFGV